MTQNFTHIFEKIETCEFQYMLVYMDGTLTLNCYCTGYSRTRHLKALLYTEHDHDHERERDHKRERIVRIGLRISNVCEAVSTKGDHERGWKLVRAESRRIASGANF